MKFLNFPFQKNISILALGAESAGNFTAYKNGNIFLSDNLGDLLNEQNFFNYQKKLQEFIKKNKFKPDYIICDLHPFYQTTKLAQKLSKKYKIPLYPVQHHLAHIYAAYGESILYKKNFNKSSRFLGIASDGTGYGLDGKIWGGEVFLIDFKNIKRVGRLENQLMIGGDLAIKEPARMVISILFKFLDRKKIYSYISSCYSHKEFELLINQLEMKFNCVETSSTARVLDAIAFILGFIRNQRIYKHQPIEKLEKNSSKSYYKINPQIKYNKKEKLYIILTTPLFKFLLKNINKNKKKLATTAQIYLAKGFYLVSQKYYSTHNYLGGGMSKNKIISDFLIKRNFVINKKIPLGDAGISFGQLVYFLTNTGD